MPALVRTAERGDGWSVTLCRKDGLAEYDTKVLIDTTGDANVVSLAGLEVRVPEENQPATLSCRASGYDLAEVDLNAVNAAIAAEVDAGRMSITDAGWNTVSPNVAQWLNSGGNNASHVHHINARDSKGKTELELEARKSLLRLYRFLRKQPGLENLVIDTVSPECGVRETATIKGKATVTADDYREGRIWKDSVCYAFYPIDLHESTGNGLGKEPLAEGTVPTVPRGALLPAGSSNMIVAGRCVSSDRLANSGLRVEASCMAMGQAAGATAALAAAKNTTPLKVPLNDIWGMLSKHGAIVPNV